MRFDELNLIPPILKAVQAANYETPTEIQGQAIPVVLSGQDMLGCAQTGTGKTAAFAIPTLQLLSEGPEIKGKRAIRALVLTPTRELALQVYESFVAYSKFMPLRTGVIFGGVSQRPQETMLQKGVDILVATPGRLLDLMGQRLVSLQHVEKFILDEADRMLDMGFIVDVKRIVGKMPARGQTLLFSATMPMEVYNLAATLLTNPVKISVAPESPTVEAISQSLYFVDRENKMNLLNYILDDKDIRSGSVLVFTRTKHGADRVVRLLVKQGVKALAIHGDKSQGARQQALASFKKHATRVLVATDIAARGLDIDELELVVNYELPNEPETYVHRIGRTGRAGLGGTAISFCDFNEISFLDDIEKLIRKKIAVVDEHPFPLMQTMPAPIPGVMGKQQQRPRLPGGPSRGPSRGGRGKRRSRIIK